MTAKRYQAVIVEANCIIMGGGAPTITSNEQTHRIGANWNRWTDRQKYSLIEADYELPKNIEACKPSFRLLLYLEPSKSSSKVVFHMWLSSIKRCLSSKAVFYQRSSSIHVGLYTKFLSWYLIAKFLSGKSFWEPNSHTVENFDGRQPFIKDNLWWKMTFDGRLRDLGTLWSGDRQNFSNPKFFGPNFLFGPNNFFRP